MIEREFPKTIFSGDFSKVGHVQGIALDTKREYIYYSFTTMLVKTDLSGKFIGSVTGLLGHFGCLDFCDADGRLYCSLEYLDDEIGKGVLALAGSEKKFENGFYIAIFDCDKITRADMDAEKDGVMTAVFLKSVTDYYNADIETDGKKLKHKYCCAGIDGLSFGPEFGCSGSGKYYLNVCSGVYGDVTRSDDDYQLISHYDTSGWKKYERPLSQNDMHRSGPDKPDAEYFLYTGNTAYGVQNLEYDEYSGNWIAAVYRGSKPEFPNHPMYIIDGHTAPKKETLAGLYGETGLTLSLLSDGIYDSRSGIWGWEFEYGSTGICSLGGGLFYISENFDKGDLHNTTVRLYRATGKAPHYFEKA